MNWPIEAELKRRRVGEERGPLTTAPQAFVGLLQIFLKIQRCGDSWDGDIFIRTMTDKFRTEGGNIY